MSGCASVSMLPQDVSQVDFDEAEGKTGWSQYKHVETFRGYTEDQIYEAAQNRRGQTDGVRSRFMKKRCAHKHIKEKASVTV